MSEPSLSWNAFSILDQLPPTSLKRALVTAFRDSQQEIKHIEDAFRLFTSDTWTPEVRRTFFHGWSLTNHSAMCVSGISNRLTLLLHSKKIPESRRGRLIDAVVSLNRISDEDLGAQGGKLHADFFYEMATPLCGDDHWKLKEYAPKEAIAFLDEKNRISLKERDIFPGILTTLVHEIYTHGEVEFILPLFRDAVENRYHFSRGNTRKCLAWIVIHCGGTESDHFQHAMDATHHYVAARDIDVGAYDLEGIFRGYLQRKSAVMVALSQIIRDSCTLSPTAV